MNRRFAHIAPALGTSVLGLGLGLAVTACSSASSSGASPAAVTKAPAPPSSAHAAPASAPAASVSPAAPAAVTPSSRATATHAATLANAPTGARRFVLWDCEGKAQVEPSSYILTCADAGMSLFGMHWIQWQPGYATGTGTEAEKECTPSCAADGKILYYPVNVTLTGSALLSQGGPFSYTKITLNYPGAAPAVYSTVNGTTTVTHPSTFSISRGFGGVPAHPTSG